MSIEPVSKDDMFDEAINIDDDNKIERYLEDVNKMARELQSYTISNRKVELLAFLYGTEKGVSKIKNLSISSDDSQSELLKIIESHRENINSYILGEFDYKDLSDNDSGSCYKIVDKDDLDKTNRILSTKTETDKITDFLKPNKFKNVFFIIKINLNESGSKKIILLKSVSQNFYVRKNRFTVPLFDNRQGIKLLKNKEYLILDENFDITIYIDDSRPFFFITDREKFEDLYEYHERYNNAYDILTKKLDFIDWSGAEAKISVLRSCYSIANFVRLDECKSNLIKALTSKDDNIIKKAIKTNGINYNVENGNIEIISPLGVRRLLKFLKILKDGVAKTCLLDRDVIGSDFEEIR